MSTSKAASAFATTPPPPITSTRTHFIFQSPKLKKLFQDYKIESKKSISSSSYSTSSANSNICAENDHIVLTKTLPVSKNKTIQILPPDHDVAKKIQKIQVTRMNNISNHVDETKNAPNEEKMKLFFKETHLLVVNMDTVNAALCLRSQGTVYERNKADDDDEQEKDKSASNIRRKPGSIFANSVAALSFANDEVPGGYYRAGARAQEEDLCRAIPELYASLVVENKKFYPLLEGEALLSQNLFCLRAPATYSILDEIFQNAQECKHHNNDSEQEMVPKVDTIDGKNAENRKSQEEFFESLPKVSIITAAMPRGLGDKRPAGGFLNPQSAWHQTVTLRIRSVLTAAKISGKKDLVLGSFGCGAFNNPPKAVAQVFRDEVTTNPEFVGCFERIVFAIIDPMGTGNLRPFLEVLS